MHRVFFNLEDKVNMDADGDPELWDEWEHYFFVGGGTTIQCVYSRAQSGVVAVTDVVNGDKHYGEEIRFDEISENILSELIIYVFNEKT